MSVNFLKCIEDNKRKRKGARKSNLTITLRDEGYEALEFLLDHYNQEYGSDVIETALIALQDALEEVAK